MNKDKGILADAPSIGDKLAEVISEHVSKDAALAQLNENKDAAILGGEIQAGRIILNGVCNFLRAVGGESTTKALENPFMESSVKIVAANILRVGGAVVAEFIPHPVGKKAVIFLTRTPLRAVGVDTIDKVDFSSVFKMFGGNNLVSLFQTWLENQPAE